MKPKTTVFFKKSFGAWPKLYDGIIKMLNLIFFNQTIHLNYCSVKELIDVSKYKKFK